MFVLAILKNEGIDIKSLTAGSGIFIHVRCDICGREKKVEYRKYYKQTNGTITPYSCKQHLRSYYDNLAEGFGYTITTKEFSKMKEKIKMICPEGHIWETNLNNFKRGKRCKKCQLIKTGISKRKSYDSVRKSFESEGYKLISEKYMNAQCKLKAVCKEGHILEINYNNFKSGKRCAKCSRKKTAQANTHDYEVVKKVFEERNYKLVSSTYSNNHKKLEAICSEGHRFLITYKHFSRGQGCRKCGLRKITGDNNYNWNHSLTQEEREDKRVHQEYRHWRESVFKRDDFTCVCCSVKGYKLHAHHLNGYHWDKNGRIDINNGVTLCKGCHRKFHLEYGRKHNTKEQFEEWLSKSLHDKVDAAFGEEI